PLPEFALMDIRMPGYRGDEVAKRIRETAQVKDIPIVLMTAFILTQDEMQQMKHESGVDHIINKPLPDFMQLKQILEDVINSKKT
ncbi:MAG: response regulator, partial [Anaerolineae bacterium]|nr:response regulator [Anaerolineae bacterium]